jgi:RNase P subunit RPR2
MRTSRERFVCVECEIDMNPVEDVPVLQSLRDHVIFRCDECGHLLLVQQERAGEWSAGWLGPLFMELEPAITCVALM